MRCRNYDGSEKLGCFQKFLCAFKVSNKTNFFVWRAVIYFFFTFFLSIFRLIDRRYAGVAKGMCILCLCPWLHYCWLFVLFCIFNFYLVYPENLPTVHISTFTKTHFFSHLYMFLTLFWGVGTARILGRVHLTEIKFGINSKYFIHINHIFFLFFITWSRKIQLRFFFLLFQENKIISTKIKIKNVLRKSSFTLFFYCYGWSYGIFIWVRYVKKASSIDTQFLFLFFHKSLNRFLVGLKQLCFCQKQFLIGKLSLFTKQTKVFFIKKCIDLKKKKVFYDYMHTKSYQK